MKTKAKDHYKVAKTWGIEHWIVNDAYCGKLLVCYNDWSSRGCFHFHKQKDECFLVIEGALVLEVIEEERQAVLQFTLHQYDSFRVKPWTPHRFKSQSGVCKFVEFSTHHEDSDTYYSM